jgi:hypothetical protein
MQRTMHICDMPSLIDDQHQLETATGVVLLQYILQVASATTASIILDLDCLKFLFIW